MKIYFEIRERTKDGTKPITNPKFIQKDLNTTDEAEAKLKALTLKQQLASELNTDTHVTIHICRHEENKPCVEKEI